MYLTHVTNINKVKQVCCFNPKKVYTIETRWIKIPSTDWLEIVNLKCLLIF